VKLSVLDHVPVKGFRALTARTSLAVLVLFAFSFAANHATAQSDVAIATRAAELQRLAGVLEARDQRDRGNARAYADRVGLPMRRVLPGNRVLELQRFTPGTGPVFYLTYNVDAADTVSTDEVWPGGSAGLALDGSGMVLGEWDGGAVYPDHPDFAGRLVQVDGASIVSNHSTHVAGTLFGAGAWLVPEARGMAYAAQLDAYDWNSDTAEMAAAAAGGLLISNHSYGIAAGWIYIGDVPPDTWWWIGGSDPSDVEDPNFGYYDAESQLWDQIAFDAPYYLIVKAAGNDRTDTGPTPGEEYTVIDQNGNFLFTSTLPRDPDCAPAGYDCLPTASVAKNILTIGAVDDIIGGYSPLAGPDSVQMAPFSSWGPSDDGRIKPDLVGNGVFLLSTWGDYPYYAAAAGTSMSAPNVTGSLILLQEHYQDLHGPGQFMRAATLKALAIHTADESGQAPGPDYAFGWGLLNTKSAARVISDDGSGSDVIVEGSLANGATDTVDFTVTQADSILTATLVWMDPPGTPVAPQLDPPDLMLVNDLDLRVSRGASTWMPWVLDPANPSAPATTGDNFRDNVEQVEINAAQTGTYTVSVGHKGTLLNGAAQDYSLIISQRIAPPPVSGTPIDEDFSGGLPPGWSIVTTRGIPWTINTPVPGDSRLDNLTGGSGKFAMVDNNYIHDTVTALRTPVLDLSSAIGAVLRFNSYFYYDTFESINVDASTDGGATWFNVWIWQGFNPFPTPYTLDLSSAIAGHANVMLQFRFDSEGWLSGDLWQVDDVSLQTLGTPSSPPGQAFNPNPANGATDLGLDTNLWWEAGSLATSHDVYFGTSSPLNGGDFQGNQPGTGFDPGPLANSTTYYWRIDEVNGDGTTAGPTWSFTTLAAPSNPPGQASGPSPADGATDQALNTTLAWTAGSLATSHDVYFGTSASLGAGEFQGNQPGTGFDPGPLANSTTYYWRIDEVNGDGTTAGPTWSFTTLAAAPGTLHLAGLSGSAVPAAHGRWNAVVTITVHNQDGTPEPDVTVSGNWSNGANGGASCLTLADGRCSVQKNSLKTNVASVSFTVSDLAKTGMAYDPAANVGSDSITVNQSDVNLVPVAADDSYQTDVDAPLNGNVMDNDTPGDGTTSVDSHSDPASGSLILGGDGAFTYTPDPGFEGQDSFTYTLIDQDGDVSSPATVTITVASSPPPGTLTVSVSPYKVKGIQHVEVTWQNFTGATVDLSRDGNPLPGSPTANDGLYDDNIGAKGGGQTYLYEVCEAGTSNCASATAAF